MVKEKIHSIHIVFLIYMIQSSIGLFSLPRMLAEGFGTNGWIALFMFSAAAMLNIGLIHLVYRLGKGKSIFDIMETAVNKAVSGPLYLFLIMVWITLGGLVAKQYTFLIQLVLLPSMPTSMLMIMGLALSFILIRKGIYIMAKVATIYFIFSFWTAFLLPYHATEFSFLRLTPFVFKGEPQFLLKSIDIFSSFLGYELAILLLPYMEKRPKTFHAVYMGNLLTTVIYLAVSFISFGFYSFEQLVRTRYPTIGLMKYIQFPFIERLEALVFSVFAMKILITIVMYYWAAQEVCQRLMPKIKSQWIGFFLLLVSYFISLIPETQMELTRYLTFSSILETGIAVALPLFLILLLLVKRRTVND